MSAAAVPVRPRKFYDEASFSELRSSVGGLDFTPDFNPAVEKIIMTREIRLPERLLALAKLKAWGNQKAFAVHDDPRTKPFTVSDFAKTLSVSRNTIYRTILVLQNRFQLRAADHLIYPVADPEAESRSAESQKFTPAGALPSISLRLFRKQWFGSHPEIQQKYQEAFRVVDEVNREIEREFRESEQAKKAQGDAYPREEKTAEKPESPGGHEEDDRGDSSPEHGGAEKEPILKMNDELMNEGEPSSSSSSSTGQPGRPEQTTTTAPPASKFEPPSEQTQNLSVDEQSVSEALSKYTEPTPEIVRTLINGCRKGTPDATGQEVASAVDSRGDWIRQANARWPYILKAIPPLFAGGAWRARQPDTSPTKGPPLTAEERKMQRVREKVIEQELARRS